MAPKLPEYVDTVIVGNGPSSLILSYILHGHVPYYSRKHHDPILHAKLSKRPCLLDLTPDLYAHFASSLRYSTQALPINTLLDTLLRPNADTDTNPRSCVEWRHEPDKAVPHLVLGNAAHAGGQWASNPMSASWDIGTLSYAEMLSLPGYSYHEHHMKVYGAPLPDFQRPSRTEVADYYAVYPGAVNIMDVVHASVQVEDISKTGDGFFIASHNIHCKHLVLASGTFSVNIPPPPLLTPIATFSSNTDPLLVIGSGFSAADVIISTPPHRKIVHIFRWDPENRPSPLRACHHQAYPEYAGIYRQMKLATLSSTVSRRMASPMVRRKSNPFFSRRDWTTVYEGLPNAVILDVTVTEDRAAVKIQKETGEVIERTVGGLEYVVGRRGSLNYLSPGLCEEVLGLSCTTAGDAQSCPLISGKTLRTKAELDTQLAPNVFITGSLTGDSLVRHAFGGCVYAAGSIMRAGNDEYNTCATASTVSTPWFQTLTPSSPDPLVPRANGIAHQDLHLDKRKVALSVKIADTENSVWCDSGWWGNGFRTL